MLTIRQRASNGNRVRPARRGHGHSPAVLAAPAEPQHSLVPSGGGSGHSRPGKAGPRGGRRPPHGLLRRALSQGPSGHTQPTAVSLTLTLGQELASVCLRSPPSRRSLAHRRRRAKMRAERTRGARASEPVPARPRGPGSTLPSVCDPRPALAVLSGPRGGEESLNLGHFPARPVLSAFSSWLSHK